METIKALYLNKDDETLMKLLDVIDYDTLGLNKEMFLIKQANSKDIAQTMKKETFKTSKTTFSDVD